MHVSSLLSLPLVQPSQSSSGPTALPEDFCSVERHKKGCFRKSRIGAKRFLFDRSSLFRLWNVKVSRPTFVGSNSIPLTITLQTSPHGLAAFSVFFLQVESPRPVHTFGTLRRTPVRPSRSSYALPFQNVSFSLGSPSFPPLAQPLLPWKLLIFSPAFHIHPLSFVRSLSLGHRILSGPLWPPEKEGERKTFSS